MLHRCSATRGSSTLSLCCYPAYPKREELDFSTSRGATMCTLLVFPVGPCLMNHFWQCRQTRHLHTQFTELAWEANNHYKRHWILRIAESCWLCPVSLAKHANHRFRKHNCSFSDIKLFITDIHYGRTHRQTCMASLCGLPCPSKAREKHCAQLLHNPLLSPGPLPHCQRDTPAPPAWCLLTGPPQTPPSCNFCFCLCRTSLPLPPLLKLLPQHLHTSHFSQTRSVLQQGSRWPMAWPQMAREKEQGRSRQHSLCQRNLEKPVATEGWCRAGPQAVRPYRGMQVRAAAQAQHHQLLTSTKSGLGSLLAAAPLKAATDRPVHFKPPTPVRSCNFTYPPHPATSV